MTTDSDPPGREERAARLLRQAAERERAPVRLRAAVAALYADPARRGTGARRRPVRARVAASAGACGSVAALALALVLGSGTGPLTLAQAAALANRGPAVTAPAADPAAPTRLLAARVGRLHFPNWQWQAGWRASGERRDRIDGRAVTTVYYAAGATRIAYSIVSAPALAPLGGAGETTMRRGGRTIVVWDQQGHTCLLSGAGVPAATLWRLVAAARRD